MGEQAGEGAGGEPVSFGLIVVGDEVLNGGRTDRHLGAFKGMLGARGHGLAWHWLLPDDPPVLSAHLRLSMAGFGGSPVPVFVCGGIGATPDDHTRACAPAAAGVPLVRHPQAQALIEGRFGPAAYPYRILMAELPAGAGLVPNPYNGIPGFVLAGHWFLPGFPEMAWPMAEWVLDRHFPAAAPLEEGAVEVLGVPESELIPLMDAIGARFPGLKAFSLPRLGADAHILLGLRGRQGLQEGMAALRLGLAAGSIGFRERTDRLPAQTQGQAAGPGTATE